MARVLVAEPLDEAGLALLRERHEVVDRPADLEGALAEAEALIVRSGTQVTAEMLARGPRLRVVGRAGVGVNNIDVEAATQRGIVVVNVPDGNTVAACEQTFALMLALARNLPAAAASLKAGRWERQRFVGVELRGKTLGVIGLGRIGQEVSRRAAAFGMEVVGFDPYVSPTVAAGLGVRLATVDEVVACADFLTVHTPLTPQTRGLIGAAQLARMKPGARVINCARGGIVDERALYEALASGRLGGAALDVFEREPPVDNPLLALENVVATPHLGASTREAQEVSAVDVARYVLDVLDGAPVPSAVNLPALGREEWAAVRPLLPLVELLASLYVQAVGGAYSAVEVRLGGQLPGRAGDLVTRSALKGLLQGVAADLVNLVNAPVIARRHGVRAALSVDPEGDPLCAELRVEAGGRTRVMAGVTGAGAPRVTNWDGLPVDIAPSTHMLVTRHRDQPGLIGRVGTLLGRAGVNIAAMQVGRRSPRGDAVMVMTVDEPVDAAVLQELAASPGFDEVRFVRLPAELVAAAGAGGA
jgi:D-3-phosphoglycerate dehydrogenase